LAQLIGIGIGPWRWMFKKFGDWFPAPIQSTPPTPAQLLKICCVFIEAPQTRDAFVKAPPMMNCHFFKAQPDRVRFE